MSPLSKDNLPFFWRKLHSLTGAVPLALFLLVHLWNNSKALQGERAYDAARWGTSGTIAFPLFEIVGLWAPLAFHVGYGALLAYRERADLVRPSAVRGQAWVVDRASSVVALAFIALHVLEFRIPVATGTMTRSDFFPVLCNRLSSTSSFGVPVAASLYLVGLAATTYHFAHGLRRAAETWGLVRSGRARRWAVGTSIALGVAAFLLGATTVLYFATGSGIPGVSRNDDRPGVHAL